MIKYFLLFLLLNILKHFSGREEIFILDIDARWLRIGFYYGKKRKEIRKWESKEERVYDKL